jgi:hypothetical protein
MPGLRTLTPVEVQKLRPKTTRQLPGRVPIGLPDEHPFSQQPYRLSKEHAVQPPVLHGIR